MTKTDMRVHWLQHVPFEGLGAINGWLEQRRATISTTRFHEGDPLPSLDGLDLIIAMGGPMSVNDEAALPWLVDECRFIREAIDSGLAVLGICLGAQLIARALDARVYRNREREIGWWPVTGMSDDPDAPRWARTGSRTTVFHWHGETFDLPQGAVPLARSAGCERQAFRIGRRVVGLQFHLETTPDLTRALMEHCPGDLAPGSFVQSAGALQSADVEAYGRLQRLMVETLEYVSAPADRKSRG